MSSDETIAGKANLIMLHSFPTNSIVLSGLIEYLSEKFNVYFIDLPGFVKHIPQLNDITLNGYSSFVEDKIEEYNLSDYYIGGISFGYAVISNARLDSKCKGILAIEPYIGKGSLKIGIIRKSIMKVLIKVILFLNLADIIWGSRVLLKIITFFGTVPINVITTIFEEISARTFFRTAEIIFNDSISCAYPDFPYVLMINKNDTTIDCNFISEKFHENVNKLLIVETTIDHFPKDLSAQSFKDKIEADKVNDILSFLSTEREL